MAEGSSSGLKKCLIRRTGQQEQHGVAAASLQELRTKACKLLAIDGASQPITLVLAEDGTIIDDDDYFLCLPQNTKFGVVAKNEKWTCTGGGTSWLEEEITNTDETDSSGEKWKALARQLKNNLSTIILMSEEDLQALVDVPCSDLARELSDNLLQTQRLQTTLQEILDRREEERQSRQLLELYLQAVEKEKQATSTAQAPEAEEKSSRGTDTMDTRSSGPGSVKRAWMNPHILSVLKEETFPQHSLSTEDLMLIYKKDSEVLSQALTWDKEKTKDLKESCRKEPLCQLTSFPLPETQAVCLAPEAEEKSSRGTDTVDTRSSRPGSVKRAWMNPHILSVLKEETFPQHSLSTEDLMLIYKEDSEVLSQALTWDKEKTEDLKESCRQELSRQLTSFSLPVKPRIIYKAPESGEKSSGGTDTVDMGSSGPSSVERTSMHPNIISLLKEHSTPELILGIRDLQMICKEDSEVLSQALCWDKKKTEALKEACLLELYGRLQRFCSIEPLRNITKAPEAGEKSSRGTDTVDMGSKGLSSVERAWMNPHILSLLKEEIFPECCLGSQDLQLICKEDPKVLCQALSWDRKMTEDLKEKCERELSRRLEPYYPPLSPRTLSNVPEEEILFKATDIVDMDSSGPSSVKRAWMNTHVLSVLKESDAPELSLGIQDLKLICKEDSKVLCQALSWDRKKTEDLKEKCERELSRRVKPLLPMTLSNVPEDEMLPVATDIVDMDSSGPSSVKRAWMNPHVLSMLKKSISPELFLSLQDLELICKEDSKVLCQALSWDRKKTEYLKEKCERELSRRLKPSSFSLMTLSNVPEDEILPVATDIVDMDSSGPSSVKRAWMNPHVLSMLKKSISPELFLSLQDLELICKEDSKVLCQALSWDRKMTEDLKEDCKRELRRRLEPYYPPLSPRTLSKVLKGEILFEATDIVDMDSSGPSSVKRAWMNTHVLSVLKENNAPELSLGVQDLKLIYKEDSKVLSQALNWDKKKTEDLKEACGKELSRRLESFNSLESLRSISKGKKKLPESGEGSSSKRKK